MYAPPPHATSDIDVTGQLDERYRGLSYAVVAVGILAMLALSLQGLDRGLATLSGVVLYLCVLFFVGDWLFKTVRTAPAEKRWAYLRSGQGLVDLAGSFAIPVAHLAGADLETASLLAVLWLLKPVSHVPGLSQLRRVVLREAGPLISVAVLFLIVLFMAAVLIHVLERDDQPGVFGSIPASLWWAVVTLTTTGYGDMVPVTPAGRLVASLLMISGLGVFGLWTGILANGFAAENRRHNSIQTWESLSKVPFFASLGPATLADVASTLRRIDLRPRTVVVTRGEPGDCMYFVAAGGVEVELPAKKVPLGVGSFFGELALLGNHTRTASVVTVKPSTLLVLDVADFHAVMARHPDLANAIDEEAARRGRENHPD